MWTETGEGKQRGKTNKGKGTIGQDVTHMGGKIISYKIHTFCDTEILD